jgi:hypothetical protein
MADLHNVFISHYSGDVQRLRDLKSLLRRKGCKVRNSSAEEDNVGGLVRNGKQVADSTIARYLKARINWAGTFIVIIGEHTHERPWVNYEIKKAHDMGKQIVGIYAWDCKEKVEIPEAYKRYGGSPLGWGSIEKLGGIIKGNVVPPEAPDCSPSGPIYNIIHIVCK